MSRRSSGPAGAMGAPPAVVAPHRWGRRSATPSHTGRGLERWRARRPIAVGSRGTDCPRVKWLRVLLAVTLATLLALAQQAGLRHAFSHLDGTADKTQPWKQHPGEKVCDQCLVFATVHGAATRG